MPELEMSITMSNKFENSNFISDYIRDIKKYPRINREKEIDLSKIIQENKNPVEVKKAIDILTESNLLLALKHAFSYAWIIRTNKSRMSILDLVSEANIGLYEAACSFNSQKNPDVSFGGYASRLINNAILNSIQKYNFIHIPKNHFKYYLIIKDIIAELGESTSDELLLEKCKENNRNITLKTIKAIRAEMCSSVVSLDADPFIMDLVGRTEPIRASNIEKTEMKSSLKEMLKVLNDREREIITYYFYGNKTFDQIAKKYGVSKQYISSFTKTILRKLKNKLNSKNKKGNKSDEKNSEESKLRISKEKNRRNYSIRKTAVFVRELNKL